MIIKLLFWEKCYNDLKFIIKKECAMRIIQTKGIVNNGKLTATIPTDFSNGEVDLVIVAENEPDELESMRQLAREKGYDSKEKILDLIKQVKREMLTEKGLI
jgi:hypothetical protein